MKQKRTLRLLKHGYIMDTEQIERLLATDSNTKSVVVGALAKDCLSKTGIASYPAAFVCNTHSRDKPGEHWICMFFTNDGRGEYLDFYGLPPRQGEFVYFYRATVRLGISTRKHFRAGNASAV